MTHWKKLTNPNYLGAYAFNSGEEKVVTITSVNEEQVTSTDGSKENCIVAHLQDEKPLILNKTNCKALEKLTGTPFIENWAGQSVILCVQFVSAFGEKVEAVRVRPMKPCSCADCGKPIKGFKGLDHRQVRQRSLEKFKRELCGECAMKQSGSK